MRANKKRQEKTKSFASKGVFPHKWAFTLLLPIRNIFLSPKQLIKRIELKENFSVLELGPGPGYLSIPIARKLIYGILYLADIQTGMLEYAKKRLNKRKIENVRTIYPTEKHLISRIISLMLYF